MHLITRISYNTTGWQRPNDDAGDLEVARTFNNLHRFGFEDWLFRGWELDGWRYSFLQGANIKGRKYLNRRLQVSLYTILPDKSRRWVAHIRDVECLDIPARVAAQQQFQQRGWLAQMQAEVEAVGGDSATILNTPYAGHYLNLRYRPEHLNLLPPDTYLPKDLWPSASYYKFYEMPAGQREGLRRLCPDLAVHV